MYSVYYVIVRYDNNIIIMYEKTLLNYLCSVFQSGGVGCA